MTEEWRAVPGYEGLYEVSSLGRVRSLDRTRLCWGDERGPYYRKLTGRVLKNQPDKDGYQQVPLLCVPHRVAPLVLSAFAGEKPTSEHQCCHNNGEQQDNCLTNLRWGTPTENAADRDEHGRTARGEKHCRAKLNNADIAWIRAARGRVRQVDLAAAFGVDQTQISKIQRGECWAHV